MSKVAFLILAISLLGGSQIAFADRSHDMEIGGFVGGYFFSDDSRLGSNDPARATINTSVNFGGRFGYLFMPWLSAEAEIALMPTKVSSGATYFVIDPRIHGVVDFMADSAIQPFALIGIGAMFGLSGDKAQLGNGFWPDAYVGGGARYIGRRGFGARADVRLHILPGREGTAVAPEFEFSVSLVKVIGGKPIETKGGKGLSSMGDEDKDGVVNSIDKCPTEPEDKDKFEDDDGCPELDNDGDTVIDASDKCPESKETINGYKDDDGCADAVPAPILALEGRLKVTFAKRSSNLTRRSKANLKKLGETLYEYPTMKFAIEAHVDSFSNEVNMALSLKRAQAVRDYLMEEGMIGLERVLAVGWGAERPSENGENERVEIRVLTDKAYKQLKQKISDMAADQEAASDDGGDEFEPDAIN